MALIQDTYAQVILSLVEKGMSGSDALKKVTEVLAKSGRSALLPRVARSLKRISVRNSARNSVQLHVVHEADVASATEVASSKLGVNANTTVRTIVDPSLIGGWKIIVNDSLLDQSYKKVLEDIYQSVITK